MRNFFDPLATAWTSIVAHKLRSFLTILGVVIGVAAVITLMSVGKGTEAQILGSISSLGTNLIYVQPGSTSQAGVRTAAANSLTVEDGQAIANEVFGVEAVAPFSQTMMQVVSPSTNQNSNVRITGVTPDYQQVFKIVVISGDFFTQYQYERSLKIALLGPNIAATLFGETDPVGQKIRSGNNYFDVVGVLAGTGASLMGSTDDVILIPLSTLQGMMARTLTSTGQHVVNTIALTAMSQDMLPTVKDDITYLLQTRHNIGLGADNDFTVTSMDQLTSTITTAMQSITLLLGAIAGISLLVGGIGVMNIMLVSVMERRREIGIRKALGAKEWNIWGQFLLDSSLLTLTGGLIGVAVGWAGAYFVASFGIIQTAVTSDIVALAVGVSVGIGLFFGFYPSWQGSRLDPIQALRSE